MAPAFEQVKSWSLQEFLFGRGTMLELQEAELGLELGHLRRRLRGPFVAGTSVLEEHLGVDFIGSEQGEAIVVGRKRGMVGEEGLKPLGRPSGRSCSKVQGMAGQGGLVGRGGKGDSQRAKEFGNGDGPRVRFHVPIGYRIMTVRRDRREKLGGVERWER